MYVCYSDIVFADAVLDELRAAEGDVCVVVDREFRNVLSGRVGHPFSQVEAVTL